MSVQDLTELDLGVKVLPRLGAPGHAPDHVGDKTEKPVEKSHTSPVMLITSEPQNAA